MLPLTRSARALPLLLTSLLPSAVFAQQLSAEQWQEDVGQLMLELRETHPMPPADWQETGIDSEAVALLEQIPDLTDIQVMLKMSELVALLNDGHSRLTLPLIQDQVGLRDSHSGTPEPKLESLNLDRLPLIFEPFDDGFFVVGASQAHRQLLGARLVAVGDTLVEELVELLTPLAHGENDLWRSRIIADRLSVVEVLAYVGVDIAEGSAQLKLARQDGKEVTVELAGIGDQPKQWLQVTDQVEPLPMLWRESDAPYWFEVMPDHNAVYLRFDQASYYREFPPTDFVAALDKASREAGVERLVIDLRDNHGGSGQWNGPFLRWVLGHPVFDRWGHLYVIFGRNTFSAAMLFVNELEQHSQVLFVGEGTGNSPDNFGDARKITLDHSGLTFRVSTLFWKNWLAGEFRDQLAPHVPVAHRIKPLLNGTDPALDAALAHQFPNSTVDMSIALFERGAINAGAVLAANASHDIHRDPDMLQRFLAHGDDYLATEQYSLARIAFLIAESYFSNDPRTYYGLGQSLEGLEQVDEAREAYQTALRREPEFEPAKFALQRLSVN